jgi:hypothetical protein
MLNAEMDHHLGSAAEDAAGSGDCSGFNLLMRAWRPSLSHGIFGPNTHRPAAPWSSP